MAEEQVVGRRMSRILGHVSGDGSASRPSPPHLAPAVCGNTPDSIVQRHGNQSYIQPQGSTAGFLKPKSMGKVSAIEEISKKERPNERLIARSSQGTSWLPKMDITESVSHFIVLIELPGVSIGNLRVEVDNQKYIFLIKRDFQILTVIGQRFTEPWKLINCSENINFTYHQREILYGPYQVTWPLPTNVNRDMVSAEFADGFLQISLPKL